MHDNSLTCKNAVPQSYKGRTAAPASVSVYLLNLLLSRNKLGSISGPMGNEGGTHMLTYWKQDRIGSAVRGENPTLIARMKSGFAVMGDTQFLPGYCVLLAVPSVQHLSDLPLDQRRDFLLDMSLLGEAIERVFHPRRTNYEILGNTDAYVHAHVWARYEWEPQQYIGGPVWRYPKETRFEQAHEFSVEKHGDLKGQLAAALAELMKSAD